MRKLILVGLVGVAVSAWGQGFFGSGLPKPSANGDVPIWNSTTKRWVAAQPPGASGGEANTASNQGTGVGLFKSKSVADLQFKSLRSANNMLTVTANADGNHVDLTIVPANFTLAISQITNLQTSLDAKYGSGANASFSNVTVTPLADVMAGAFRRNSAGQTANILEIQTEANATLSYFDKTGTFYGAVTAPVVTVNATGAGAPMVARTHASTVATDPFFGVQNSGSTWLGGFLGNGGLHQPGLSEGAVKIDANKRLANVTGNPTDCVLVNGTSGSCGSGGTPATVPSVTITAGGTSGTITHNGSLANPHAILWACVEKTAADAGNPFLPAGFTSVGANLLVVSLSQAYANDVVCSATGQSVGSTGSGSGAVDSVDGQTGVVSLAATYAPIAKGVTNGDSHDHNGGDGAQIAYSSLSGTPTLPANTTATGSQWLTAYNSTTGAFTKAQPAFTDISGSVTDAQVPDSITVTLAATATALAANGSNCSATQAAIGVGANGAAEGCWTPVSGPASAVDNTVAVYDSTTGKLLKSGTGCTISGGVLTCTGGFASGDGTAQSMLRLPELTANGSNDFRIYGAADQSADGCIVVSGQPSQDQILKATASTVTIDAKTCRVMSWQADATGGAGTDLNTATGDISTSQIEDNAVTALKTASPLKIRPCNVRFTGSGASSVLQDTDDEAATCSNVFGATLTITAVYCRAEGGAPTIRPIINGGAANSILSADLTCGNGTWSSAGTLNGTPTQTSGQHLDLNIVSAGGAATKIEFSIVRTL